MVVLLDVAVVGGREIADGVLALAKEDNTAS